MKSVTVKNYMESYFSNTTTKEFYLKVDFYIVFSCVSRTKQIRLTMRYCIPVVFIFIQETF